MAGVWRENINLIRNGDSVEARTPNRPLLQLADRTQYLKDRLDAAAAGEGLVIFSQPLDSSVSVGDVVYFDKTSESYKKAIAAVNEGNDGILRTSESSFVIGIVVRKLTSTSGDILINGRYQSLTLQDADDNDLAMGQYYLSATEAGKLVSTRPAVGVFVCTVTNTGVIVSPTPREVLEDHVHYRFDLSTDVAGTPLCIGTNRASIEFADADIEGWLPADHSVFQNNAPSGAAFGYNIWQNASLSAAWPPQPLGAAYVERDGVGVAPEHVVIDDNGIWWMTDCMDYIPWERDYCVSSSTAVIESSSTAVAELAACDVPPRRVTLWFTRLVNKTNQAAVSGIKPADGSPIVVSSCAEADASGYYQGKCELDLNIPWTKTTGVAGSQVVKGISGNGDLSVGPVVEQVKGAGLVRVSGSGASGGYQNGSVTITGLDPTQVTRQLDVSLVALDGALESIYQDSIPYIGFPAGRSTSFTGKIRIPDVLMTNPYMKLDIWFMLPTLGTPPANVTITRMVVPSADSVDESSSSSLTVGGFVGTLPTTWSSAQNLDLDQLGSLQQGSYFSRQALKLPVHSNELVLFRVTRSSSDSYNDELGVLNMVATIYDEG